MRAWAFEAGPGTARREARPAQRGGRLASVASAAALVIAVALGQGAGRAVAETPHYVTAQGVKHPAGCPESRADFAGRPSQPVIALVIDGLTPALERERPDLLNGFLALTPPLAFTVDPRDAGADALIARIRGAGHEALLRLPVAPGGSEPEPDAGAPGALPSLHSLLPARETASRARRSLEAVSGYVGAYVGPGSPITENAELMKALLLEMRRERCLLIDGRSENKSVVHLLAGRLRVASAPVMGRIEKATPRAQAFTAFEKYASYARPERGVVVLAYVDEETLAAIGWWMRERKSDLIALAPVSAAVRGPTRRTD